MCNGVKLRKHFIKFASAIFYGGLLILNLKFNELSDIFSIVISLILYFSYLIVICSSPGYLDLIKFKQFEQQKKSQMAIPSPQEDKQFSFDNPVTKVLQSSIVLYKKKGITSHIPDSDRNVVEEEIEIKLPQKKVSQPVIYIEQPACYVCNIDQLQRTKHCRKCGHCVLTFDHHNIIFGQCIGEKNKFYYHIFLILQIIYIFITILTSQAKEKYLTMLVGFSILTLLFSLLCFQLYLIVTNQTQTEYLTPYKLTYMKQYEDLIQRPYDRGIKKNLQIYFRQNFIKAPQVWEAVRMKKIDNIQSQSPQ